ncbi:hypothetical protein BH09ACT4_BH09ACT4_14330 [soil metagenome]
MNSDMDGRRDRRGLVVWLVLVPLVIITIAVVRTSRGLPVTGDWWVSLLTGSPIGWGLALALTGWLVAVVVVAVHVFRRWRGRDKTPRPGQR